MNRILLSTTLLLTAGLFGQSAQAAPQYIPSVTITSPLNKSTQISYWPALAQVPCSVTNQCVQVTGATPSSTVTISWTMADQALNAATNPRNPYLALDQSNGPTVEMTDKAGNFTRYLNGGKTGSSSQTVPFDPRVGGLNGFYAFCAASSITDPSGTVHSVGQENTFVVDTVI